MIEHHQYPDVIQQALGETAAAGTALGSDRQSGRSPDQLQGPGPMHLLVVQAHPGFSLTGSPCWKGELPGAGATLHAASPAKDNSSRPSRNDERTSRYQGVVPVEADRLAAELRTSA
jgi:redox-regulated HSP33 family molecular chaperone